MVGRCGECNDRKLPVAIPPHAAVEQTLPCPTFFKSFFGVISAAPAFSCAKCWNASWNASRNASRNASWNGRWNDRCQKSERFCERFVYVLAHFSCTSRVRSCALLLQFPCSSPAHFCARFVIVRATENAAHDVRLRERPVADQCKQARIRYVPSCGHLRNV